MAPRKIGPSWWADFSFNKIRYRLRSPENSRIGATIYEAYLRRRMVVGHLPEPLPEPKKRKTLRDFSTEWFETYVKANNKPSEQRSKETSLRLHLLPHFGSLKLDEITSEHIEKFKAAKLAKRLDEKTVNNHLGVLGKCLRTAEEWGLLDKVPKIKRLKTSPGRVDFLTPEEVHAMLAVQTDQDIRFMMLAAVRTGMRLGELLALGWEDVNLGRRLISVRRNLVGGIMGAPKSHRTREIPAGGELYGALAAAPMKEGFVFAAPGTQGREPRTAGAAAKALSRLCKRAGVRHIGWHVLRHTFATHLVAKGVSLRVVQDLLGHSTIMMTTRYAHVSAASMREAVEVLEEVALSAGGERHGHHPA